MSDKQAKIKKMIEMQKMFIEFERKNGVNAEEYFAAKEGHILHNYRQEYAKLATEIVELAHAEKGSHR